jgi:glycosyltransferase involved in cell wall biosynthesis
VFSIIIPLYNKEQYVAKTLDSVFAQTYEDFEIIIVDDGSTDNSLQEVDKFNDPRIRIIKQKNGGVSSARNRGIAEAKYDFIAFLDADDEWLHKYLMTQLNLINKFPNCHVFATSYFVHRKGQKVIPKIAPLGFENEGIINYFCAAYQSDPLVWTSAVIVKKGSLQDIGGFPVGITSGEDLIVWAKLAAKYKIAYSNEAQSIYHVDENSWDAGRPPDTDDYVGSELKKLLFNDKNNVCLKKYISFWHKIRASMYIKHNEHTKALQESTKALFYNPSNFKNYQSLMLSLTPFPVVKLLFKYKEWKL